MDFIVGIPKERKKLVIMVVVECISKYAPFCALSHPFTPDMVTQVFTDQIFKLHGMPISTMLDQYPTFNDKF